MNDLRHVKIQRLIQLLRDPRRGRSLRAEYHLIAIGRDAVEPLVEAAASIRSKEAKLCILWALGKIGDPRGFDTILNFTRDDDSFVRYEATWALGKLGDERAIEILIEFLGSEDESGVGGSAENALAEFGERAIPALLEEARSSTGQKRVRTIYVLSGSRNEQAIKLLSSAIHDSDEDVRIAAIEALGQTGEEHSEELGQRCLDIIQTAFDDPVEIVRDTADAWAQYIRNAIQRQPHKRPMPRSHRLRLIGKRRGLR